MVARYIYPYIYIYLQKVYDNITENAKEDWKIRGIELHTLTGDLPRRRLEDTRGI